jgi:hypothetical protein
MPFFKNPGVADDQHPTEVPELLDDPGAQVVAQQVGVPVRRR